MLDKTESARKLDKIARQDCSTKSLDDSIEWLDKGDTQDYLTKMLDNWTARQSDKATPPIARQDRQLDSSTFRRLDSPTTRQIDKSINLHNSSTRQPQLNSSTTRQNNNRMCRANHKIRNQRQCSHFTRIEYSAYSNNCSSVSGDLLLAVVFA